MTEPRYDWTIDEVLAVIERPFHDLLAAAHACHRGRFDPHEIEGAKLLSIKTGACPEDCAYCPQSARNETDLQPEPLMDLPDILAKAEQAKAEGGTRFCMGAAWRSPNDRQVDEVAEAVHAVADLGMETCVTLGMLTER
jgi:biotin synthase